jgi:hypothetical protein
METLRREVGALGWLLRTALIGATAAAIYQELRLPAEKRTWHGKVAGFVPYDFRIPTPRRVIDAFWRPRSSRLFNEQPFGVGWAINLPAAARLVQRVIGASR